MRACLSRPVGASLKRGRRAGIRGPLHHHPSRSFLSGARRLLFAFCFFVFFFFFGEVKVSISRSRRKRAFERCDSALERTASHRERGEGARAGRGASAQSTTDRYAANDKRKFSLEIDSNIESDASCCVGDAALKNGGGRTRVRGEISHRGRLNR